jgi:3-methyl-2-oxobutanoate hydroxymethyltransferase
MNIRPETLRLKKNKEKIIATTAYDYTIAKLCDAAHLDVILVGDSVGMVCHGDKNTHSVTMDQMIYHTEGVARAVKHACVISDMPIHSYSDPLTVVENARRLLKVGAHGVKIEEVGNIIPSVKALVQAGIPVMGHVGLTPQTAQGFKVQGKKNEDAEKIMRDACAFDEAGVFSIVLECIPADLAEKITKRVLSPTIGIGAGAQCDGQILVCYDLLGLFQDFRPKFVRHFCSGSEIVRDALRSYRTAIEDGTFPGRDESFI